MTDFLEALAFIVVPTAMLVVGRRLSRRSDARARDALSPYVGRQVLLLVGVRTLRERNGQLQSIEAHGVLLATDSYEYFPFNRIREMRTDDGIVVTMR